MTWFATGQAERAAWQRRAAAELAGILNAYPDLPVIAWTIGTAGATLSGRVLGCASPAGTRQSFESWRAALMLTANAGAPAGAVSHLHATAQRHRVRVNLAATVFHDDPGQHPGRS
jgi:hypothetical protein